MAEVPSSGHRFNDGLSPGRFESEQSGEATVLRVLGEIDLSNARNVLRVLDVLGEADLVVDLTEVEFMDSAGLGILVELESQARGEVRLMVMAKSQVDRLLDLTGLKAHFDIEMIDEA
jgi:anti-sigma B factor antagonist